MFNRLPNKIHKQTVKFVAGPYFWAAHRKKQNIITRSIRRIWRAL